MALILVAEDEAAVREFVTRALEMSGHEVIPVHDGGEAAQTILSGMHDFDLVLSDVQMPVMDGIALALKVAASKPDLPILLMSGYIEHRERAGSLGKIVKDIITKPFTLKDIQQAVEKALG